ncbi:MAG TPA: lysine--tRNA ligase [Thermoanaerobaculia bacterium]|jgi:lysyl-tRNA synthetase class 2|nr:lysine--tRNA ligase [Thermoanaerobaculia bacterium]
MSELDEQIQNRREKRQRLEEAGIPAYPHRFVWDLEPSGVKAEHGEKTAEELEAANLRLRVPGRVRSIRKQGKLVFADVHDGKEKLQLFIRKDRLPEKAALVLDNLDLGDVVGAEGQLIRTRTGEISLMVDELAMLSKALRPAPEKWHGLADVEVRYRQRYLDLASNEESRIVFETRAAIVQTLRAFLDRHGFLEVETPMMHLIPGGATARPFKTHHNALDLELFLRIAPELFLKRLLVGGIPRVYEINRNFRNEGISTRHNPEFTMLEFYWAYADYRDMMDFTEEMLSEVAEAARKVQGREALSWQGQPVDLARPWDRLSLRDAVTRYAGIPAEKLETVEDVRRALEERHLDVPAAGTYGHLLMALFEETAEEHLVRPTFITDHPVDVSPLSKQRPDDPRFTERFELYIAGMEMANAFSELNDPDIQADRFRQQAAAREKGDVEAHLFDHDYIRALEHAMPPAAGNGIGIDRLTMLLTDRQSIRDVILFPLMRPEAD